MQPLFASLACGTLVVWFRQAVAAASALIPVERGGLKRLSYMTVFMQLLIESTFCAIAGFGLRKMLVARVAESGITQRIVAQGTTLNLIDASTVGQLSVSFVLKF
jgi:hypothetical protein